MEQGHHLADLTIDPVGTQELREIARWGKFLSIIGFVMLGLIIIVGIFLGTIMSKFSSALGQSSIPGSMAGFVSILYILLALIYFFPVLFLYQSSTRMKAALNNNDQHLFNEALTKMKACFRYIGILTIIFLSIYALFIVFFIIGASVMK